MEEESEGERGGGWVFDLLLIGRHEAMPWLEAVLDLGIVDQKEEGALARLWVLLLRHSVPRTPNLCRLAHGLDCGCRRRASLGCLVCIAGRATGDVCLMPLALNEAGAWVSSCEGRTRQVSSECAANATSGQRMRSSSQSCWCGGRRASQAALIPPKQHKFRKTYLNPKP